MIGIDKYEKINLAVSIFLVFLLCKQALPLFRNILFEGILSHTSWIYMGGNDILLAEPHAAYIGHGRYRREFIMTKLLLGIFT